MDEAEPLQTISQSGQAPTNRIKNPSSALDIVEQLYQNSENRRGKWAETDRMFDGAPPYDPLRLRQAAQAHRSNSPSMLGKSILSVAATTYYDLFNAAETFFQIELEGQPVELSRALTLAIDRRLKEWPDFYLRAWALINDYVRHGKGFLFWGEGWKFQLARQHRVLVPEASDIDLEKQDLVVVLQTVSPIWLWKKIRDSGGNWNRGATLEAIRNALPPSRLDGEDAVDVQASLRDNDLWVDSLANRIQLAHVYVKEFSGSWTHLVLDRNRASGGGEKREPAYLYQRRNRFQKLEHFCSPFFFEVMDGSWNGASGLGKDIFPLVKHYDRVFNAIMDAVYLRTGVNLQATDASALRRLSAVQIGGAFNVFPPGFNAVPATVLGDLSGALSVDQMLNRNLERNTGIYRPQIASEKGNPETATEVRLKFLQATVLTSSAVDRWYTQENRVGAELFRRMRMDRRLMKEIAEELGVEEKLLTKPEARVTAARAVGNGSQSARQQAVFGLQGLMGMLPEAGRQNWLDDAIAALSNQTMVERWNPKPPISQQPSQQEWEAQIENENLVAGVPVFRYPEQNDFIHARNHVRFMAASVAQLQKGGDPLRVLTSLNGVGPHAKIHLEALAGDQQRKAEVETLNKQWLELARIADQLKQRLQQQQQRASQQPQPAPNPEMAKAAAKIEMDRAKTAADIENRRARTAADIEARQSQARAQAVEDLANKDR